MAPQGLKETGPYHALSGQVSEVSGGGKGDIVSARLGTPRYRHGARGDTVRVKGGRLRLWTGEVRGGRFLYQDEMSAWTKLFREWEVGD